MSAGDHNNDDDAAVVRSGTGTDDLPQIMIADDLHAHHIATLAYLLMRGARLQHVEITTTELGRGIKRSQQSASRHISDLEQAGLVERGPSGPSGKMSVRITDGGMHAMESLFYAIGRGMGLADQALPGGAVLEGTLVSGMGEGAYYMALAGYTGQFRSKIGYVPFPGTLNIRLRRGQDREATRLLRAAHTGLMIGGFSDGRRTYGWVRCLPAVLAAGRNNDAVAAANAKRESKTDTRSVPCKLIFLERTHHDDTIIELISDVCLRDAASISDGSDVTVRVLPSGAA